MLMNKKIFLKDWLLFKAYNSQSPTDIYYLELSNMIKSTIRKNKGFSFITEFLDENEVNKLSCFLASYLEDLVSDTNFWNSFINIHKRLYNKPLPFYNIDEYYEGEINPQDIGFLIWYFLNTSQTDKFVFPYVNFMLDIASDVFDILEIAWESAPANEHLKSLYQLPEEEKDFYKVRSLLDKILFRSYLFYTDAYYDLEPKEEDIFQEYKKDKNLINYLNENRDSSLFRYHTRLLGLSAKEWGSEILLTNKELSQDILNVSKKLSGYFLYQGQDSANIYIEHIASGRNFKVTRKSFDFTTEFKEGFTIIHMGIVKWKEEWWFSGIRFQSPYDPDLILDEKNSTNSRMAANFLDYQNEETKTILTNHFKIFLEFNNGEQIAFLKANEVETFMHEFIDLCNQSLNLSEEEIEERRKSTRKKGFFQTNKNIEDFTNNSEECLIFFNPKSGCEIVLYVNAAFPLPNNPYFKKEESDYAVMRLLSEESFSKELVMYCIDKCQSKLPFFTSGAGKYLLNDIDFLLRFWKKGNYHAEPSITLL
jgi:hypothetical protein